MQDLFQSFIADLEQMQGQPVALSETRTFAFLFDGDVAVESTPSDDGRSLVTDVWVDETRDLPAARRGLLLALLLEMNGYAGATESAFFSLDEESRIVLSRIQPLARLTAAHYLAALQTLLEQTRQMRQIILTIHPVVTIRENADPPPPGQA